jgi:hypothetical protein
MQSHRLSHMAAIMAAFDMLSVGALASVSAAPQCTEPLGMSAAGLWFAAHGLLSLLVLVVTTSHSSLSGAGAVAGAAGAASLAPRAYTAVSALFTVIVFGSILQLPAAGVLSGEFTSFQSPWAVDGSRSLAVVRRTATAAAFAAAAFGVYNGGAFLLLNDFRIVRLPRPATLCSACTHAHTIATEERRHTYFARRALSHGWRML